MSAHPQPSAGRVQLSGEEPRCNWCGNVGRRISRHLIQCDYCGVATTHPAPSDAELDAAYQGWYRPRAGRFGAGGDALLRRLRGALASRLDRLAPAGPILDVGAGEGALIEALHALGRDALGLERATDQPDVRACELAEFDERMGQWAGVVLWHSLEHLRAPAAGLDRACELLAPGGLLVLAVPNHASWQARLFGDRWFALDTPRHLVHLNADSLLTRLRARGLEVQRVSFWRGGQIVFGWLHGLVGSLPGHPNLYIAIRRPRAREQAMSRTTRMTTLALAVVLWPLALVLAAAEVLAGAGGTVMIEAVLSHERSRARPRTRAR